MEALADDSSSASSSARAVMSVILYKEELRFKHRLCTSWNSSSGTLKLKSSTVLSTSVHSLWLVDPSGNLIIRCINFSFLEMK
jgi:hypothetical protein